MWERTLKDLIRGLRANKQDESKFIAKAVDEIRVEIRSDDMELKAAAVLKLTYLDMLGYDMSWAAFHVVEVMSSPRLHLKSVGYLAAAQSFNQETDVLMLTTNLLKKDLGSNPLDVAVTLNGLSHIITPDLGRDVASELIAMLNHSRPHIRKRSVLALCKVFTRYPAAVSAGIGRLKEKLQDSDPSVVATTVNALCELAQQNPEEYLPLAPQLFHLLTTSSNNWMLIKIVKLFAFLSPHEPRLAKKLHGPITDLISTTPAISLLYECVRTCIIGGMLRGPSGDTLARLCVSKLAGFLQDPDQNLKYIALLAAVKIVPTHPYLLEDHQDTILASISDQDISIRMRALDLATAMVNRDNLQPISQHILTHLASGGLTSTATASQSLANISASSNVGGIHMAPSQSNSYRLILAQRLLSMCSQSTYENVNNFEWYLTVLVDLAHVARVDIGTQIRDQLVDIVGRVRSVRPYAVQLMYSLLQDDSFVLNASEPGSCAEVLWAAAWICGEYASETTQPQKMLPYFLQPSLEQLSADTIAVYIQAAVKIFGAWTADIAQYWKEDHIAEVKITVDSMVTRLQRFTSNSDMEVQERAANSLHLFNFIQADLSSYTYHPTLDESSAAFADTDDTPNFPKSMYLIQPLFSSYGLNPVAPAAQESVPVPDGLDLDSWIVPPPPEPVAAPIEKPKKSKKGKEKATSNGDRTKSSKKKARKEVIEENEDVVASHDDPSETTEERADRERRKAERLERLREDPYYINDTRSPAPMDDIDSIPIVRLDDVPLPIAPKPELPLRSFRDENFRPVLPVEIDRVGEMPPGALLPKSSRQHTPTASRSGTPSLATFPAYDVEGIDLPRTPTPDPIKVVRPKKKKPASAKA